MDVDWFEEAQRAHRASDYRSVIAALRTAREEAEVEAVRRLFDIDFSVEAFIDIITPGSEADGLYVLGAELWSHSGSELEAVAVFREAASQGSEDAVAVLGDVLGFLGAHSEAVGFLRQARDGGFGDQAWVAGLLGLSLRQVDKDSPEIEGLLREGSAEYCEFGVDYAHVLRSRGALDEAVAVLRALVDEDVYGAAIQLGNILDDALDDQEGAAAAYLKGIESKDARSAFNLAVMHYRQGNAVESKYYRMVAREMGDSTDWSEEYDDKV